MKTFIQTGKEKTSHLSWLTWFLKNTNGYQFTWVPFYLFKFQSDVTIRKWKDKQIETLS